MPAPKRPVKPAAPKPPARSNPAQAAKIGASDTKSRLQADHAANQGEKQSAIGGIPITADGRPMVLIEMAAAELIPTGQYANVSVGPAKISWWIDPLADEPISDGEKQTVAKALNDIAEICEVDVVAVQRNLVLESIQTTTE